jgi:hypothetical protein
MEGQVSPDILGEIADLKAVTEDASSQADGPEDRASVIASRRPASRLLECRDNRSPGPGLSYPSYP